MAAAAARHANAFDLFKGQIRHVDIQNAPCAQRLAVQRAQDRTGHRSGSVIMLMSIKGNRQRREPQMAPFHCCRDRTGVDHVIAQIWACVDTRDHYIRAWAHQRINAQEHAVRRRSHLYRDIAIFIRECTQR
ncbi:hypothetical protein D3C85_1540530 [compost metagenome]